MDFFFFLRFIADFFDSRSGASVVLHNFQRFVCGNITTRLHFSWNFKKNFPSKTRARKKVLNKNYDKFHTKTVRYNPVDGKTNNSNLKGTKITMTKRITAILLTLLLSASLLASCGGDDNRETEIDTDDPAVYDTDKPEDGESKDGDAESDENPESDSNPEEDMSETENADAKSVLGTIYPVFLEKAAPAFGASSGDEISNYFVGTESETVTETDEESGETFSYEVAKEGPGAIDLADADALYPTLFPAEDVELLDSAAVFYNMMNRNNGTFAAFALKNADDAQTVAATLKDAINGNHWMCGFPERLFIANADGVLVSAFGNADFIDAMKSAVAEVYETAVVLCDEGLSF